MLIVADRNIPYLKGVLDDYAEVRYLPGDSITAREIRNADALLVRTRTRCDERLLHNSAVRFIGSATIGFDHIDTRYCCSKGITWTTAPGCNAAAVQQWVASAIAYWLENTGRKPSDLTIGIVGVGHVGQRVVDLARILGMKTLCCDPPRKQREGLTDFIDIDTLVSHSDIVTFHVPLTTDEPYPTHHIMNSRLLNRCKPDVFLLNSSRGAVAHTRELLRFLESNPDASIAVDVWENEPEINSALLKRALVATPHIAGYSLEGKVTATRMIIDAVSRYFGMGLHPWKPLPDPLSEKVRLPFPGSILAAIRSTYSVMNDDIRYSPCSFEQLRNTYTYRRDFSGYRIDNAPQQYARLLKRLGFNL